MSHKALYDILCSVKRHMNARVFFRCCLIQPSVTATLHSQNPTIYAILKKQRPQDQVVGGVLDSGAQRGATGRKSEILKHTGTSLLMQPAVALQST